MSQPTNTNMALWESVKTTDPKHVKEITGKAYKGNSPKPYYIIQRATEVFGPCGIGWGFSIVEEKLMQGAKLGDAFYEQIHFARVKVWYLHGEKRGEVEHVGQTLFSGKRANGNTFTDEDAPKKSVTDALIKALSLLGFAGDIFIGQYDDSKYVATLREEAKQSNGATKPTPAAKPPVDPAKAASEWLNSFAIMAEGLPDADTTHKYIRDNIQALRRAGNYEPLAGRVADYLSVIGEAL